MKRALPLRIRKVIEVLGGLEKWLGYEAIDVYIHAIVYLF